MLFTYKSLLYIHIYLGAVSLFIFWIPIVTRKGGRWHVRAGRWYANAMYAVAISAFVVAAMVLLDPIGVKHANEGLSTADAIGIGARERLFSTFLLAISVLVFTSVRHGLLTVRAKRNHGLMKRPSHVILNAVLGLLGIVLAIVAFTNDQLLFYVFAGICVSVSVTNLRYCFKKDVRRVDRTIAHMGSMIGAGIGSYTAFFVFGGNRFFAELLTGNWQLIPWTLPAIVGTGITIMLARRYRRQFAS